MFYSNTKKIKIMIKLKKILDESVVGPNLKPNDPLLQYLGVSKFAWKNLKDKIENDVGRNVAGIKRPDINIGSKTFSNKIITNCDLIDDITFYCERNSYGMFKVVKCNLTSISGKNKKVELYQLYGKNTNNEWSVTIF